MASTYRIRAPEDLADLPELVRMFAADEAARLPELAARLAELGRGDACLATIAELARGPFELRVEIPDETDPWSGGASWLHFTEPDVLVELWSQETPPKEPALARSVLGPLLSWVRRIEVRRDVVVQPPPPGDVLFPVAQPMAHLLVGALLPPEVRRTLRDELSCFAVDDMPRDAKQAIAIYSLDGASLFVSRTTCHWFDLDGADPLTTRDEVTPILVRLVTTLARGQVFGFDDFSAP